MAASTNIHPEALAAALAGAAKAPPPGYAPVDDQAQGAGGGPPTAAPPTGAPPDQSAPPDQGGAPGAPGAADPSQQAVWDEFPATDPQQIEQLVQALQGADPSQQAEMLGSFMQQADADRQKLDQMHEAMLSHMLELLGGPGGAPQEPAGAGAMPPQGPGVGGMSAGY